jgi:hypothetical protein
MLLIFLRQRFVVEREIRVVQEKIGRSAREPPDRAA